MTENKIKPAENIREKNAGPYSFEKMFGAAFVGALAGVITYYVYNQLSEDTRCAVKKAVISGVKSQMAKFAVTEEQ